MIATAFLHRGVVRILGDRKPYILDLEQPEVADEWADALDALCDEAARNGEQTVCFLPGCVSWVLAIGQARQLVVELRHPPAEMFGWQRRGADTVTVRTVPTMVSVGQ